MEIKKQEKGRKEKKENCSMKQGGACGGGAFYGLGFIGAIVYYVGTATGFWVGVLGVLKSIVWPVFLVYGLLKFLGM